MLKKDGKLFGKISIIDLLAVIAIVVLVAGLAFRFSGSQPVSVSTGEKMECVVQVRGVRQQTIDALSKLGPVYDIESKEYVGEIIHVEKTQNETMLTMNDGSKRLVPTEGRYNALVTIAFTGNVSAEGYYTDTNRQMSVGGSLGMNTKYVQCWGGIDSVKMAEEK